MEQNWGRGGAILTSNELVLPFGGSYVCANFGGNRSRKATVRVLADGQIHRQTDANRFYNLLHAICYSYGTANNMDWRMLILYFENSTFGVIVVGRIGSVFCFSSVGSGRVGSGLSSDGRSCLVGLCYKT